MNLDLELKERVDRRAVTLLPLRQVATRLQKVVADPGRTLWELIDAVKVCPMLTASVLRLANAPGSSRRPATLPQAIAWLGDEELTRLALGAGLGASTDDASPLLALRRRVMQDSLTAALICEQLAPEFELLPDELFLAGLLHDVGTLIALGTLEQIISLHAGLLPLEAAQWMELAQRHHVELGLALAEQWGLPAEVRLVIERHHQPEDGALDATSVVRLSDRLLALMNAGVALADAQLPCLDRIAPGRRARLLERLATVPARVAGFEEQRPYSSSSSILSMPPARPPPSTASYGVRVSGGRAGQAQLISAQHLLLRLESQLPENYLAELELALPGAPMKVWVRVVCGAAIGTDGFAEAEVVPFAPTQSVAQRLAELWDEQQQPALEGAA